MRNLSLQEKNMLEKAFNHYYSVRIAPYLQKEDQVNIYKNLIMAYCNDRGYNLDELTVESFIFDRIKDYKDYGDDDAA
ncbi:MAG: hypothetical protein PHH48_01460 [Eubacteriales bacterium]|nr:hypothetical protein [Eubacteriales bacterium]